LSDEQRIGQAMVRDRRALREALRRLGRDARRDDGTASEATEALLRWRERLEQSVAEAERRRAALPKIAYPESLPITEHAEAIARTIREHQVTIVCGETGSGKSTQLPKILLQAGYGATGLIGHTQPRRIAARAVASRLAEELGTTVGDGVGFKIRFTDRTSDRAWVKLMTDGILLAESQTDRDYERYDAIIVDEAHERSLNIDFLIGYLHRLRARRPDLRIVITSATLDADRFASHFGTPDAPAPIFTVAGRTYPVEIRYRTDGDGDDENERVDEIDESTSMALLQQAVTEVLSDSPGDVLIFLPTEGEIRAATKRLRGAFDPRLRSGELEILPLYARLSAEEQNRVFRPARGRRLVLATNVAESSLTVPGIRSVIDTGTARISRYAPRTKVQRLPIEAISRASADQRAGRCGRVGPGLCLRLYAESDYETRDRYTTPEIRRTDLASVILRLESLRLSRIDEFPFLDPPRPDAIKDGYRTLFELGAVDGGRRITELGRRLARLPVHPRTARMLLAADQEHCLADMLIVASGLEIQDPRERPAERRQAADEKQRIFRDSRSDFLSLLRLWDFQHRLREEVSSSQWRKGLADRFLSVPRILEWRELHRQLMTIAQDSGLTIGSRHPLPPADEPPDDRSDRPSDRRSGPSARSAPARAPESDALHRALLTGLLSGVAKKTDKGDYLGAGGLRFHLWPGSGLADRRPEWIMVNEIVETSRRFGRTAAAIDVGWIEPLADHLVSRSYGDPRWMAKPERVMADERVSLFGLPIVVGRPTPVAPRDPELARRIFIENGLVDGGFTGGIAVLEENHRTIARLQDDAAKVRETGRIVDDRAILEFYRSRIPDDVVDGASLRRLLKESPEARRALTMTAEDLLPADVAPPSPEAFPDRVRIGRLEIPLDYRFEPGTDEDGVTATLPAPAVNQLSARQLGWLVPGLVEPRITAMIRSLPKPLRRNLVPAPDVARKVAAELRVGEGDFVDAVAKALTRLAGEPITRDSFGEERLPDHLRVNLRLVDETGAVVAQGRDLERLREQLGDVEGAPATIAHDDWTHTGLTDWEWGDLPERVAVRHGDLELVGYPGIVDEGTTIGLRLFDLPAPAEASTRRGLARLATLQCRKELRSQLQWLPGKEKWGVLARGSLDVTRLDERLGLLIASVAMIEQRPLPRSRSEWEARLAKKVEAFSVAAQSMARVLPELFRLLHETRLAFESLPKGIDPQALEDLKRQRHDLLADEFPADVPWIWLQQVPRYLQGMIARIEKLPSGAARDRELRLLVEPHRRRWSERREADRAAGRVDPELETFRWYLEEYRVSLWAQQLGTSVKVSPQRLDKQWERVGS